MLCFDRFLELPTFFGLPLCLLATGYAERLLPGAARVGL